jgi:hypothetical protein
MCFRSSALKLTLFLAAATAAFGQETSSKHAFGIVPTLDTFSITDHPPAWTTGRKFKQAVSDSFDRSSFLVAGVLAGISQWEDQFHEYGQGAEGYAKRFGSKFGDRTIGLFMTRAIFPSMLHQDPRYYRMGDGAYKKRFMYAISRTIVTRNDDGARAFNYSEVIGYAASSAVSNAYYPDKSRTAGNSAQNWGFQIATDAGFNVLKEFWPDIQKKVFHSK